MRHLPVLMCVGRSDVDRLFLHSLTSCVQHLQCVDRVVIVTPDPSMLLRRLQDAGVSPIQVDVFGDDEVLEPSIAKLPGWSRQQAIKLQADTLCGDGPIVCLGADTVLLRPISLSDLFEKGAAILYYNRYQRKCNHLEYERRRVDSVARLLRVKPVSAWPLGDFIMDFTVLDGILLRRLRDYLATLYGSGPLAKIIPRNARTLEDKASFGEWTLYAVFLLDVLQASVPIRNSDSKYLAQIHSQRELDRFCFDSRIAHFVSKRFDLGGLRSKLAEFGVTGRFP